MEALVVKSRKHIVGSALAQKNKSLRLAQLPCAHVRRLRVKRPDDQGFTIVSKLLPYQGQRKTSKKSSGRPQQGSNAPKTDFSKYKLGKYRVERGDTLSKLSRHWGVPVKHLAELNKLENPNLIHAGAQLLVTVPEEFAQELLQHESEGAGTKQRSTETKGAREIKGGLERIQEALAKERKSLSAARLLQAAIPFARSSSKGASSKSDGQYPEGIAQWPRGVEGLLRARAYTVNIRAVNPPRPTRIVRKVAPQWASLGVLILIVAASTVALRVGADRLWGAYVTAWEHLSERKEAVRQRQADLEAAKRAEADRRRSWWRSVIDDDRKAAQLAPDAINGSVRSRLPSEPSIGRQAREIEQKRLEEEYNTFIRKIKVKEKHDGLIG